MTGSHTPLEELLVDTGSDAWVDELTPPGLPDDFALILQNPQGANLDIATIDLLSLSLVFTMPKPSFNSPKNPSLIFSAPSLIPTSQVCPAINFAMPNFMDNTLSNNSWCKMMVHSTLPHLIGEPTTCIGAAIAAKSGSLSMPPTTLRLRPAIMTRWLNPYNMALLLSSQPCWLMTLALTPPLHPLLFNMHLRLYPFLLLMTIAPRPLLTCFIPLPHALVPNKVR